jgi:IclR family transcriptional regulator, pca regulon regulatory protein
MEARESTGLRSPVHRETSPLSDPDAYFNKTAHRTMLLLEALAGVEEGLPLQHLAQRLNASKSSVYPIVRTLLADGYLEINEPHGYRLTHGVARLARGYGSQQRVIRAFYDELQTRNATVGGTAILVMLTGRSVICVAEHQDEGAVTRISVPVGTRVPAHASAAGKALLATLPSETVHLIAGSHQLERFTEKTQGSLAGLLDELEHVRRQGWAEAWAELDLGVAGVGATVRDERLGHVAAIEILLPVHNAEPDRWNRTLGQVRNLAEAIAARIRAG